MVALRDIKEGHQIPTSPQQLTLYSSHRDLCRRDPIPDGECGKQTGGLSQLHNHGLEPSSTIDDIRHGDRLLRDEEVSLTLRDHYA